MNILGIDPSFTATGLALLNDGEISLKRIRTEKPVEGLRGIRDRVRYVVGVTLKFAPAEVLTVIEAPIVVRGGRGGLQLERAWLFGLLVDQLVLRGPVVQVRPKTRAKYATSNGNAAKPEVLAAVRATHPGLHVVDDNVADALALLALGARWKGVPIDGALSKKQLDAMAAVVWPMEEGSR